MISEIRGSNTVPTYLVYFVYSSRILLLTTVTLEIEKKSEHETMYSKASRYTALRSTDLGDTRFLIGSQNT